ncbi:MAG TPA: hypothetical protein DCZ95_12945 [Verrucomicrobia bacterium]|nr:MAG: hypothetical protein A2X46_11715 [Lentisphaerae bacterium GWF2_57_35]HBA84995.1 hypothetical protein [Verrucomicrobiota bacterium]
MSKIWLLFCVGFSLSVLAEDTPDTRSVTPVVLQATDRGDLFLAGQSSSASGDVSLWVWKADADGKRYLEKTLSSPDREEVTAGRVNVDGSLWLTGSRFEVQPRAGHRAWLKKLNRLAELEPVFTFEEWGRPGFLFAGADSSLYLAGTTPASGRDESRHDGWLVKCSPEGEKIWEKTYDRGSDESMVGAAPLDDGYLLVLASSRSERLGRGPSSVWLLNCSAEGELEREVELEGARILSRAGVAAASATGFAVIVSTSGPPGSNEIGVGSASLYDALVFHFDRRLKQLWKVELKGYSSFATPALAAAPGGGFVVAGPGAEGVRLTRLSDEGAVLWEKTAKIFSGQDAVPIAGVSAATVAGGAAYVLGMTADLMSRPVNEKAYLLKVDLETGEPVWTTVY